MMMSSTSLGRRNGSTAICRSLKIRLNLTSRLLNGREDLGDTFLAFIFFRLGRLHLEAFSRFLTADHGFRELLKCRTVLFIFHKCRSRSWSGTGLFGSGSLGSSDLFGRRSNSSLFGWSPCVGGSSGFSLCGGRSGFLAGGSSCGLSRNSGSMSCSSSLSTGGSCSSSNWLRLHMRGSGNVVELGRSLLLLGSRPAFGGG